ncbi:MAG: hypothetical protein ACE5I5_02925 [Candidatus Heimdallarchaeota archaeon]
MTTHQQDMSHGVKFNILNSLVSILKRKRKQSKAAHTSMNVEDEIQKQENIRYQAQAMIRSNISIR